MSFRRRIALVGTAGVLAFPLRAQQVIPLVPGSEPASVAFERAPYRLQFDHVKRTWTAFDNHGRVRRASQGVGSGAFVLELPPGRPVEVVVVSANPLLYEYALEPLVVRSGNVRACSDVGRGFASSGFLVAVGSVRNMNEPPPPPASMVSMPGGTSKGVGERLGREELQSTVQGARAAVAGLTEFVSRLQALPAELDDSLASLAERGDAEALAPGLDRLLALAEQQASGLGRAATVPTAVNTRFTAVRAPYGALAGAVAAIRAGQYAGDTATAAVHDALDLSAQFDRLTNRRTTLSAVRALQRKLSEIERTRARLTQSATVPESRDIRRLVLRLKPTTEYPDAIRSFEGSVEAFLRPGTGMICEVSTGFNLMNAYASYRVATDGTLENTANDDIRASPALFFHLTPARMGILGAVFGAGLGADRAPDLYLGVTLRILAPVLANGGLVWQRHRVAPGGVHPGDVVPVNTRVEDFKRRFSPGWFMGISIAP